MALIVQKYGGTSVGDIDRIKNVAQRIKKSRDEGHSLVVVVSARFHARHEAELSLVVYAGADSVVPVLGTGDSLLYRSHVRAQENGIFFALCNRVGVEGSSRFFGRSVVAGPTGAILGQGDDSEMTLRVTLRATDLEKARNVVDVLGDLRPELYYR